VSEKRTIEVSQSGRVDKILAKESGESRAQISKLISAGAVFVNGESIDKPSFKLKVGDTVSYHFLEAQKREKVSVDFDVEILYEDDDLLVVNKPAGLVVHPAPSVKEATLVDWLVDRGISLSTIAGEERFGIVHRLDKETTGALVVAKNNKSHQILSEELKRKEMGRFYLALIDYPLKDNITVELPIGRNPVNRLKMAVTENGRYAKTDFLKLLEGSNKTELISARLHTGRTHQIRVHLSSLGRHILGDVNYGFKSQKGKIDRVFLHAYLLYLTHPKTGEKLKIKAPLFGDMIEYLDKFYNRSSIEEILSAYSIPGRFSDTFDVSGGL